MANGSVTGSTGCNPLNTTYDVQGSDELDISDQITTGQALCDEAVTGQEALHLDLLVILEAYELRDDELVLIAQNPDPEQTGVLEILTFEKN